jgi:hypothetical protein
MKWAALALTLAACSGRAPIASCADDLQGAYAAPSGRWMVLDNRPKLATLEAYPLFDDATPARDVVVAPRVIDLALAPSGGSGTALRRYMRGGDACVARAAVHLTSCRDDMLELVLADLAPPLTFAPCTWPAPAPAHVERWHLER